MDCSNLNFFNKIKFNIKKHNIWSELSSTILKKRSDNSKIKDILSLYNKKRSVQYKSNNSRSKELYITLNNKYKTEENEENERKSYNKMKSISRVSAKINNIIRFSRISNIRTGTHINSNIRSNDKNKNVSRYLFINSSKKNNHFHYKTTIIKPKIKTQRSVDLAINYVLRNENKNKKDVKHKIELNKLLNYNKHNSEHDRIKIMKQKYKKILTDLYYMYLKSIDDNKISNIRRNSININSVNNNLKLNKLYHLNFKQFILCIIIGNSNNNIIDIPYFLKNNTSDFIVDKEYKSISLLNSITKTFSCNDLLINTHAINYSNNNIVLKVNSKPNSITKQNTITKNKISLTHINTFTFNAKKKSNYISITTKTNLINLSSNSKPKIRVSNNNLKKDSNLFKKYIFKKDNVKHNIKLNEKLFNKLLLDVTDKKLFI